MATKVTQIIDSTVKPSVLTDCRGRKVFGGDTVLVELCGRLDVNFKGQWGIKNRYGDFLAFDNLPLSGMNIDVPLQGPIVWHEGKWALETKRGYCFLDNLVLTDVYLIKKGG